MKPQNHTAALKACATLRNYCNNGIENCRECPICEPCGQHSNLPLYVMIGDFENCIRKRIREQEVGTA